MIKANPDAVIAAARGWLGTPYHDQASLRGIGCDCLGLARGIWRDVVGAEPQAIPQPLQEAGKPTKVAITACARKLLTILNAMFRNAQDHQKKPT